MSMFSMTTRRSTRDNGEVMLHPINVAVYLTPAALGTEPVWSNYYRGFRTDGLCDFTVTIPAVGTVQLAQ